jgi:hypothetical protein
MSETVKNGKAVAGIAPVLRSSRSFPPRTFADDGEERAEARLRNDNSSAKPSHDADDIQEVARASSEPLKANDKDAKMRRNFDVFDLDLVKRRDRKPKSSLGWMESKGWERVKKVVLNVVLFPFHLVWWRKRVPTLRSYLYYFAGLYVLHAFSILREVLRAPMETPVEFVELIMPLLLLIVMAVLMGQAAASAMAPVAPPERPSTSLPVEKRAVDSAPSPARSEGSKPRKLHRRQKSEASVNNDSTNEILTNDEDMDATELSSDDSDSSETSSDSSVEDDGKKHHRPHVAVRRSSLLGHSPVPQHLGAPIGLPSPQSGGGGGPTVGRKSAMGPKLHSNGLPPLPSNHGQSVSPQNLLSVQKKRKQRHFFPTRFAGAKSNGMAAMTIGAKVESGNGSRSGMPGADSDTEEDEDDADMVSAQDVDLNETTESSPRTLQRNRLFSHSMEDLLDAVKSVHWSAHGPEKVLLTPGQIRAELERKVFEARVSESYRHLALVGSLTVALVPICYRLWLFGRPLYCRIVDLPIVSEMLTVPDYCETVNGVTGKGVVGEIVLLGTHVFGKSLLDMLGVFTSFASSFILAWILLGYVAGAVETFKRRYMYAKYFSKLTSSRKARRAGLPYFRLHKVDHIKVWLSLRSRRADLDRESIGPYRSSDVVAHFVFMVAIFLVGVVAFRAMQNMSGGATQQNNKQPGTMLSTMGDWILGIWALLLAIFVQRIMALASKTHERFMDTSVLLTEELNIHMRLLRKPEKKDELNACNQMLKVAAALIKELEGGKTKKGQGGALVLDPWLYSIVRVILLSALGALSSDLFGFRVRFWKI